MSGLDVVTAPTKAANSNQIIRSIQMFGRASLRSSKIDRFARADAPVFFIAVAAYLSGRVHRAVPPNKS
jgi:hypothetical protein